MARVHFHMPPELAECDSLEESRGICIVCLMVARGAQLDYGRKAWEQRAGDGKDEQAWYAYQTEEPVDIRAAVVLGISDMIPQAGLVPVCWDHLAGIVIKAAPPVPPALLQANGALPPEAFRGKGGRG